MNTSFQIFFNLELDNNKNALTNYNGFIESFLIDLENPLYYYPTNWTSRVPMESNLELEDIDQAREILIHLFEMFLLLK